MNGILNIWNVGEGFNRFLVLGALAVVGALVGFVFHMSQRK
jgi:hypothetical protein